MISHSPAPKLCKEISNHPLIHNCLYPSAPQPTLVPQVALCLVPTDLGSFFSSCSSQALLSRGPRGAWMASLPHGPSFSCSSLGKEQKDSNFRPPKYTLATLIPLENPFIPTPKLLGKSWGVLLGGCSGV